MDSRVSDRCLYSGLFNDAGPRYWVCVFWYLCDTQVEDSRMMERIYSHSSVNLNGSWYATHGIWNSNISPEASASFENPIK